jgi:hypothetical protein
MLFIAPTSAHAQISINEIMYDPSGADGGREWIELYNDGAADVIVVGGTVSGSWRVCDGATLADCSNHTLVIDTAKGIGRGTLTVPAGGFLVVASDPNVFVNAYGGSFSVAKSSIGLTNTAGVVALVGGDGTVIDSVTYTKDDGAAGDGNSLQRIGGGWGGASPTPGAANARAAASPRNGGQVAGASYDDPESPVFETGTATVHAKPPSKPLAADAGPDRTVMAGADVVFEADVRGREGEIMIAASHRWTFGDGSTGDGRTVTHRFAYPGKYVVVLTANFGLEDAMDKVIVTVVEPTLQVSRTADAVALTNTSGTELDISHWRLRAGGLAYELPDNTFVLPHETIHISDAVTRLPAGVAVLMYPSGVMAASAAAVTAAVPAARTIEPKAVARSARAVYAAQPEAQHEQEDAPPEAAQTAAIAAAAPGRGASAWQWGAFALAGFAAVGFLASRRAATKEWTIIDDAP